MSDQEQHEATTYNGYASGNVTTAVKRDPELIKKVDDWLAQGEQFKESLRTQRQQLIAELKDVEQKLTMLGVDVAGEDRKYDGPITEEAEYEEVAQDRKRRVGGVDSISLDRGILLCVTDKPQKTAQIAKKAHVTTVIAYETLMRARSQGKVKRSGPGGSFWQLAQG